MRGAGDRTMTARYRPIRETGLSVVAGQNPANVSMWYKGTFNY